MTTVIRGDERYGGLARIIRYSPPDTFPVTSMVAMLDPKKNLLLVNRELFDTLDATGQRRVLNTTDLYVEVTTTHSDAAE